MTSLALKSAKLDIERSAQTILPIDFGGQELQFEAFAYQGADPAYQALALLHRDPAAANGGAPIVRVHSGCVTGDIFHSLRCDCYAQLQAALGRIVAAPIGAIIYLPYHEGRGIGLVNKIRAYALQDQGYDTVEANERLGFKADQRDYATGVAILHDLGVRSMRLMSNNPRKLAGLTDHGVVVSELVPLEIPASDGTRRYLKTKKEKLGHVLSSV